MGAGSLFIVIIPTPKVSLNQYVADSVDYRWHRRYKKAALSRARLYQNSVLNSPLNNRGTDIAKAVHGFNRPCSFFNGNHASHHGSGS